MELVKTISFHLGNIEDEAYGHDDYETVGKVKGFTKRLLEAISDYNPDKEKEYEAIEKMIYDKDFVKYSSVDAEYVKYYFTNWREKESSFIALKQTIDNRIFLYDEVISKLEKIKIKLFDSEEAVDKIIKIINNVALLNTSLSLISKEEILNQIIKDTGDVFWENNLEMASIYTYFLSTKYFFVELALRKRYKESDKLKKEKYPF